MTRTSPEGLGPPLTPPQFRAPRPHPAQLRPLLHKPLSGKCFGTVSWPRASRRPPYSVPGFLPGT